MTHCSSPGPHGRALCGLRLRDAMPYCGPPRFVRRLAVDAPHCPDCIAALDQAAPIHGPWTQLELAL